MDRSARIHKVLDNDAEDRRCPQARRPGGNERNCGAHLAVFVLARPFPRATRLGDRVDVVT